MSRIDLNEPYVAFLKEQVEAGLFRSITAAAEDAIRRQMEDQAHARWLREALAKSEEDIRAGRGIRYEPGLIRKLSEEGRKAALEGKPVRDEIKY